MALFLRGRNCPWLFPELEYFFTFATDQEMVKENKFFKSREKSGKIDILKAEQSRQIKII